jgi:hypothetical protein
MYTKSRRQRHHRSENDFLTLLTYLKRCQTLSRTRYGADKPDTIWF